jgi:tetratricopeptide (TPR) repeat protein
MEDDTTKYYNKGINYAKLGRHEKAIASYNVALLYNPDFAEAWNSLGVSLNNINEYDRAIDSFNKAISINPDYADAWINQGLALKNLGQYTEALFAFDKAFAIKPDDAGLWFNRGVTLNILDRNTEALRAFDKALIINSDFADAWYHRGLVLHKIGGDDEAVTSFDRSIAINPNNANAWTYRGLVLHKVGRDDEAVTSFDRSIAINPNNANAWTYRGVALYNLGRQAEAVTNFNEAIALNPNHVDAYFGKGKCLYNSGLQKEAFDAFNKAVELNANDETNNDLENDILDYFEPKFEPIFTKLTQTGNLQYIENFSKKFPNSKKDTPDFSKLQQLLKKRGCSLSPEKLNLIIEIVSRKEASRIFKAKMLHNNPKTAEDLIRNFLEVYGENYNQFIDDILKILCEDFSYEDQDIHIDISRIWKEIELKKFESCLISDSDSGEQLTINDIDIISGYEFEILLKRLFESRGYSVIHTSLSNDQGADLIIEKFGERTVVQAKNWQNNVDNGAVQEVFTAINHYDADKSLVISSSGFTNGAIELAQSNNVELWDREKLSKMLKENPIFKK